MKKSRIALGALVLVGIVLLIIAIAYVSLLGENNKIDELTQAFFQEIREGNYLEAASGVQVKAPGPAEEPSDSLFLLELSLLKHYDLLGSDAYEVVTRKSHLWIPFIEDNPVEVAVSLRKTAGSGSFREALSVVGRLLSSRKDADFVGHLLTVRRRNGAWVVESANISDSVIGRTYDDMREELGLRQHVTETRHGFVVHEFPVSLDSLSPLERRLLLHVFQKAQTQLEGTRPAPSTGKIPGAAPAINPNESKETPPVSPIRNKNGGDRPGFGTRTQSKNPLNAKTAVAVRTPPV